MKFICDLSEKPCGSEETVMIVVRKRKIKGFFPDRRFFLNRGKIPFFGKDQFIPFFLRSIDIVFVWNKL